MSFKLDLAYIYLMGKLGYVMYQTYWIIIYSIMFLNVFLCKVFKSHYLKRLWLSRNWFALEIIMPLNIPCSILIGLIHLDASKLSSCCVFFPSILKTLISFDGNWNVFEIYLFRDRFIEPPSRPFISIFSPNKATLGQYWKNLETYS